MKDLVELINIVTTFEERSPPQELGKDAPYGPDIDYAKFVSKLLQSHSPESP